MSQQAPRFGSAFDVTYTASEAMSTAYVGVKIGATPGTVALAADTELCIGILQGTAAAAGDPVVVRVWGETYVKANAAITLGDFLKPGAATGKLAPVTSGYAIAQALEAATAQDDEILAIIVNIKL